MSPQEYQLKLKQAQSLSIITKAKSEMMLFEKLIKSWNEQDVQIYRSFFRDDWQMTYYSTGKVITRADDNPEEEMREFMKKFKRDNSRCVYENDDILITSDQMTNEGQTGIVTMIHLKKDGMIWRTEMGETPQS